MASRKKLVLTAMAVVIAVAHDFAIFQSLDVALAAMDKPAIKVSLPPGHVHALGRSKD